MRSILPCVALLLALAVLGPGPAGRASDEPGAVELSPSEARLEGEPGDRIRGSVTLRNGSGAAADCRLRVLDWSAGPDGRVRYHPAGTRQGSCALWIGGVPSEMKLGPGESREIPYVLAVPEGTGGTHRAAVLVSVEPEVGEGESITIRYNLGHLVHCEVRGEPAADGS